MSNKPGTLTKTLASLAVMTAFAGCASSPGKFTGQTSPLDTKERVGDALFLSQEKLDLCLKDIAACTSTERLPLKADKADIFSTIGMNPDFMTPLSKECIQKRVYGAELQIPYVDREAAQDLMNSLEGYSGVYRDVVVKKTYGLTATRRSERGTSVEFTFVFQKDKLSNAVLYNAVSANAPDGCTPSPITIKKDTKDGYLSGFGVDGLIKAVKP